MKKLIALGVGAALALAACGGSAAPAPTAAPGTAGPATAAPAAPAATAAATAAAPAASAAGPARKIDVTATNDLYSIQKLDVAAGEKIEFVLKNTGDEKHNLVAVGESVSIASPDFDGGATVNWVWTAPPKAGEFKFVCAYHPAIPPILVTVK